MKKLIIATLGLGLLAFGGTAMASNCTIKLKGDDRMQFDQKEITVSAACKTISIELEHTGKLPAAAMGHNVVVAATADVQAINAAGAKAGAAAGYLPAGDAKVLGATDMIGGGASTKASFPGSKLKAGGDYAFFCSFPGHAALMKGKLVVTP
ncbi:azurin [Luteimonas padinae]|uniref:Azurin n=1 Tax=Luteimonas padinae TaxID=1714359 RepID=A0ABV6SZR0_9GAMM|nr:azurin [Luteimonas padinae]GHD67169.1 azurin [Luteimonas padinae]